MKQNILEMSVANALQRPPPSTIAEHNQPQLWSASEARGAYTHTHMHEYYNKTATTKEQNTCT